MRLKITNDSDTAVARVALPDGQVVTIQPGGTEPIGFDPEFGSLTIDQAHPEAHTDPTPAPVAEDAPPVEPEATPVLEDTTHDGAAEEAAPAAEEAPAETEA